MGKVASRQFSLLLFGTVGLLKDSKTTFPHFHFGGLSGAPTWANPGLFPNYIHKNSPEYFGSDNIFLF